jgi:hypothetical protein
MRECGFVRVALGAALAAALAGCPAPQTGGVVEPGPGGPTVSPAPPGPDPHALDEGFTPAHPRRAMLGQVGRWKLSYDEEWRTAAADGSWWLPFDLLVMEERPSAVRVVAERGDLRYALWIPLDDLMVVPTERVVFSSELEETVPADGPSVQLASGAVVEVLERKDGWASLRVDRPEVQATGWVRETRIGRVFVEDDFNAPLEVVDLEPAAGTAVYDRPDGTALAVLRPQPDAYVRVKSLGPEEGGWREILYPTVSILVHGWVRADRLTAVEAESPAVSSHSVSNYDASGVTWLDVPAGTTVRAGPDGEVFAYCFADTKLVLLEERPARGLSVALRTLWGDVPGWVDCTPPSVDAPLPEHVPCVSP